MPHISPYSHHPLAAATETYNSNSGNVAQIPSSFHSREWLYRKRIHCAQIAGRGGQVHDCGNSNVGRDLKNAYRDEVFAKQSITLPALNLVHRYAHNLLPSIQDFAEKSE